MRTSKTRGLGADLEAVRQRFERWRQTRKEGSRIPDTLWTAAVKMVGRYGMHRTAKALRLGYYSLKERIEQQASAAPDLPERAATTFLEVAAPAAVPVASGECTVELENVAGMKMRVRLKGSTWADWAAVCRTLWDLPS